MRGVAGEEDAAVLQALGDSDGWFPGEDTLDLDIKVWDADCGAQELCAFFRREVGWALAFRGGVEHVEDPFVGVVDGGEEAGYVGAFDHAERELALRDEGLKVCVEEDVQEMP